MYLSKLYVSQNEIMKLLETSKKAVELYPNNADAYFNLGIAYYHWQDFKNARIFFQRAVDLNDYVDAHLYLAYIDNYEGDVQNAIKELRHRLLLRRDDLYANKARELLYQLTHSDSTDVVNGHSAQITSNSDSSRIEVGVSQTRF